MRRSQQQVTDPDRINELLHDARYIHVAMTDGRVPYLVPMNFVFSDGVFYFHCAGEGRKLDILKQNPAICVSAGRVGAVTQSSCACGFGMEYFSVIAEGNAEFITEAAEKESALRLFSLKYSGGLEMDPKMISRTTVFRMKPAGIIGKVSD